MKKILLKVLLTLLFVCTLSFSDENNYYQRQLDSLPDVDIMSMSIFNNKTASASEFYIKYIKPSRDFYTKRIFDAGNTNYQFVISLHYKTYDQKRRVKYERKDKVSKLIKRAAIEGHWVQYFYRDQEELKKACKKLFADGVKLNEPGVQEITLKQGKLFLQIRDNSFIVTNHAEVFSFPTRAESKTEWPSDSYYQSPELETIFDSKDYFYISYRASLKNMLALYQGMSRKDPEAVDKIFSKILSKQHLAEIVKERIVKQGKERTRIYLYEENTPKDYALGMENSRLFGKHNETDMFNLIPKELKSVTVEGNKVISSYVLVKEAAEMSLQGFELRMERLNKHKAKTKAKQEAEVK